jgi:hypothetical protein
MRDNANLTPRPPRPNLTPRPPSLEGKGENDAINRRSKVPWAASVLFVLLFCSMARSADDKSAPDTSKAVGEWSGNWVDTWQYKGQGGKLSCSLTADKEGAVRAVFKAPGFMKDPVTVTIKLKPDGDALKGGGSVELGKPAGVMTFTLKLSGEKFTGEYTAEGERGTFELARGPNGR